jgi:hypothetical protein
MKSLLISMFILLYPSFAAADPSDYTLLLDSYKLEVRVFTPGVRPRINTTLLCLDEFDYVYMKGFIEDADTLCGTKIEGGKRERDRICEESKAQIRKRCKDQELKLKTDVDLISQKFHGAKAELADTQARHKDELLTHYVIEGSLAAVLIGVVALVISK